MSNLSKLKRDRLLEFLNTLREENGDNHVSSIINEIEIELTQKKYGLVWEEHSEKVDEMLKENIPVFTEVEEKKIVSMAAKEFNFLLEGDNLHSLKLLEKTHKGAIDIIYIDPPYNTGNKDFKYDDNYVDLEDGFRHSKWLSFMYNRLKLARSILSNNGVMFMSIDDNEQSQLKLLADSIFGDNSFIITIPRQTKKSGKTTGSFSKNHDYVLVYTKNNKDIFKMEEHFDDNYKYEDEFVQERGKYKLNQTLDYDSLSYSASLDYPIEIEGEVFYPGSDYEKHLERKSGTYKRADWAWRWNKRLFEFGYENGFIVINRKANGSARIYTKTYLNAKINKDSSGEYFVEYVRKTKPMSSLELTENIYSNDRAKRDLALFGLSDKFEYTKPVELIKRLIKCHKNNNAIVLDFFAGSGTTAQSVLLANEEDQGNRKFILCTNNENGICENVTYKRVHDSIKIYDPEIEYSEVLYEKAFNRNLLKSAESVLNEIDEIEKTNKESFDKIKTSFSNDSVTVFGITKKPRKQGAKSNLKYYKTDFIPKLSSEESILSDRLLNHIREMVELEHMCAMDGKKHVLILDEEVLDSLDFNQLENNSSVYIPSYLLLTREQENIAQKRNVKIVDIPDYYFIEELKEVGEL